jgi:Bacterial Ig domain
MRQTALNIRLSRTGAALVLLLLASMLLITGFGACASPAPPPPPTPTNQPPFIDSITSDQPEVATSTEAHLVAVAGDPDGDILTYQWSADSGTINGEGSTITWSAPAISDNYTIKLTVSDGKGGTATASTTIAAIDKPNHPPIVNGLTIDGAPPLNENTCRAWITKTIHVNAEDPDGDPLTYLWRTTGGKITGEGSTVGWTSPGVNGLYTVTVVVSDNRGARAEGSVVFKVLCCGKG